jgi:hypothetical protein
MVTAGVRTRPLVAVLSRVPILVEALAGAFAGIADLHAISSDDVEAHGLVRAFRPDAVVAEGEAAALVDEHIPCVQVDFELQELRLRDGDAWRVIDADLSPEAIRNVLVACLYGGEAT